MIQTLENGKKKKLMLSLILTHLVQIWATKLFFAGFYSTCN